MGSTDETRWRQRLSSFGKALAQLNEACVQDSYSNLERAGLVKTFELTWKVLKDLLSHEGLWKILPARPSARALKSNMSTTKTAKFSWKHWNGATT